LETTGIDVAKDHIVELCYIKIYPCGNEKSESMRIRPVDVLGNTVHIPEQASAVHGIYDEDVKDCPTFKDIADDLLNVFRDCDLAGYNSNHFDIPLLVEEFLRIGINFDLSDCKFVDVCVIFKKMEQRTLSAAYKFYCKKDLVDAHSALADTQATVDVLEAQLDFYPELQNDIQFLSDFSTTGNNIDFAGRIVKNEKNQPVFNFGKYKGQLVKEVLNRDPGYYSWMLQGDFPLQTKQVLKKIKLT
jgi:DNA polymerase-3 subunit epsilon